MLALSGLNSDILTLYKNKSNIVTHKWKKKSISII